MVTVDAIKDVKQIEEMKKVLKKKGLRDYCLFVLGINVGLRISDLLQLQVKDIDFANNTIKEKKTGKTRVFQINTTAKEAIDEYLKSLGFTDFCNDMYIFKSRKGGNKPISRIQAWTILNDAAKVAGIEGRIGTHSLRKTFGYWAYTKGADLSLLQMVFNHSTPAMTLRYIGITQEEINDVYINLNL